MWLSFETDQFLCHSKWQAKTSCHWLAKEGEFTIVKVLAFKTVNVSRQQEGICVCTNALFC